MANYGQNSKEVTASSSSMVITPCIAIMVTPLKPRYNNYYIWHPQTWDIYLCIVIESSIKLQYMPSKIRPKLSIVVFILPPHTYSENNNYKQVWHRKIAVCLRHRMESDGLNGYRTFTVSALLQSVRAPF